MTGKFYQALQKKKYINSTAALSEIEENETFPNAFYEINIPLIRKSERKNYKDKNNYRQIFFISLVPKIFSDISKLNTKSIYRGEQNICV